MRVIVVAVALLAAGCPSSQSAPPSPADASTPPLPPDSGADTATFDWRTRPIYMVMLDRFANGDPGNDNGKPDGCFDPVGDRRFHGGDLEGLTRRAEYLSELGVGAVWITPLYEQVGCGYHGYWADYRVPDDRAMEPRFGTDSDFDALLTELHGRGISLMLDMIVNHSGRGATIVSQRPSWFHPSDGCEELGPPVITCPLSGLPDFAQEIDEVADYITDVSGAWLARFDIDGVRMDTAKHVERRYFSERWFPRARSERPGLFVVAEVFDASSAQVYAEYFDAGFDSVFHFALRQGLIDVFAKDQSTNALADRVHDTLESLGLERALYMTLFLDNHDVPRWSEETSGPPADTLRRYRLALGAMFTLPGIPQLYYGDELGLTGSWPTNRRDMPAWAWSPSTRAGDHPEALPDPAGTFEYVKRLATIRRDNRALWRGTYVELWRQNAGSPMFAYFRGDADNRVIVVINNGDAQNQVRFRLATNPGLSDADRAALGDGTVLTELLGAGAPSEMTVADGRGVVTLPARSIGVYRAP